MDFKNIHLLQSYGDQASSDGPGENIEKMS